MGKIVGKIVLTGGPCAGKTTALTRIEEDLLEKGYHVFIVSESATELIKGGIRPFGQDAIKMLDFQKVIIPYQLNKEASYDYAVSLLPEESKCVLIYDRGVMDNKAYITDQEFEEVIMPLGLQSLELLDRYDMVLHLVTAADGKEEYYTLEGNQARSEGLDEARNMDKKTMNAWNGHDQLHIIDNTTDFNEKMFKVLDCIYHFLGNPISLRMQKNYLVDASKLNLISIPNKNEMQLEQYYLKSDNELCEKRLRKRIQNNQVTYYYTVQKKEAKGLSKIITDKKITKKEFERLLSIYEVESFVDKTRYCFVENKQYYKLDVFEDGTVLLQIDVTEENPDIHFPIGVPILEEVTSKVEYQNKNRNKRLKTKNFHLEV